MLWAGGHERTGTRREVEREHWKSGGIKGKRPPNRLKNGTVQPVRDRGDDSIKPAEKSTGGDFGSSLRSRARGSGPGSLRRALLIREVWREAEQTDA